MTQHTSTGPTEGPSPLRFWLIWAIVTVFVCVIAGFATVFVVGLIKSGPDDVPVVASVTSYSIEPPLTVEPVPASSEEAALLAAALKALGERDLELATAQALIAEKSLSIEAGAIEINRLNADRASDARVIVDLTRQKEDLEKRLAAVPAGNTLRVVFNDKSELDARFVFGKSLARPPQNTYELGPGDVSIPFCYDTQINAGKLKISRKKGLRIETRDGGLASTKWTDRGEVPFEDDVVISPETGGMVRFRVPEGTSSVPLIITVRK